MFRAVGYDCSTSACQGLRQQALRASMPSRQRPRQPSKDHTTRAHESIETGSLPKSPSQSLILCSLKKYNQAHRSPPQLLSQSLHSAAHQPHWCGYSYSPRSQDCAISLHYIRNHSCPGCLERCLLVVLPQESNPSCLNAHKCRTHVGSTVY